jgi:hypothetical protein
MIFRSMLAAQGNTVVTPAGPTAANTANLNGTSQYFTAVDSVDWDLGSADFAVGCKVKMDTLPTSGNQFRFIGEGRGLTATGPRKTGWSILYDDTGNLLRWYSYNGSTETTFDVSWSPSTATWYDICIVRTTNDLKIYVDNSQVGATGDVTGITYDRQESNGIEIGHHVQGAGATNLYLDGATTRHYVVKKTVSASERGELTGDSCWGDLTSGITTNAVFYADLANWTGHTGQELTDQSGSGNTLTNVNSTPFDGTGFTISCT